MGLASLGSASAMPIGNTPAAGENAAQNARVVCDQWGRCYNTRNRNRNRNRNRGARHYRNDGYYGYNNGYYQPQRSYGFGPFGIFSH